MPTIEFVPVIPTTPLIRSNGPREQRPDIPRESERAPERPHRSDMDGPRESKKSVREKLPTDVRFEGVLLLLIQPVSVPQKVDCCAAPPTLADGTDVAASVIEAGGTPAADLAIASDQPTWNNGQTADSPTAAADSGVAQQTDGKTSVVVGWARDNSEPDAAETDVTLPHKQLTPTVNSEVNVQPVRIKSQPTAQASNIVTEQAPSGPRVPELTALQLLQQRQTDASPWTTFEQPSALTPEILYVEDESSILADEAARMMSTSTSIGSGFRTLQSFAPFGTAEGTHPGKSQTALNGTLASDHSVTFDNGTESGNSLNLNELQAAIQNYVRGIEYQDADDPNNFLAGRSGSAANASRASGGVPGTSAAPGEVGITTTAAVTSSSTAAVAAGREPLAGQVVRAVYAQAAEQARPGTSRLTVRLDPPELGAMSIQLTRDRNGLSIKVTAREAVTMDMLLHRGSEIEAGLKSRDVDLNSLEFLREDVTGDGTNGSGHRESPQQTEAGANGSRGRVARTGKSSDSDRVPVTSTSHSPTPVTLQNFRFRA